MSDESPARLRLPELSADTGIKVALWLVSVAVLNFLVGSPVTDLYIGFSLVATIFWVAWKTAGVFDAPPDSGIILLTDRDERRYRGRADENGAVSFRGPDGREWTGSAWEGRWTLEDSTGKAWWGRVSRKGEVRVHDEEGTELLGELSSDP